ncbi:MAG TPA: hypothetical protein VFC73_08835 [Syntrophomonadaceae bacterium]|nr:hypothetical protein [Syntrophomonadaceae bacterium]
MIKGKTSSGFEFAISKDVKNDYELIENLGELEDNPVILGKIVNQILGKEQTTQLKNHIRSENGIVPIDKMTQEIIEIFKNSGEEIKNS